MVDVFSGCGGLTLGVQAACDALGVSLEPLLAVDTDRDALRVYGQNFPDARLEPRRLEELVDSEPGAALSSTEKAFRRALSEVDIVVGGPPCQGHSDLNNHTRRDDPKNRLYVLMARLAEVLEPAHLMIENVPGAVHDRNGVVQQTWARLQKLGYEVDGANVLAADLGVAQKRRRFVTVASRQTTPRVRQWSAAYHRAHRPLSWAIEDLLSVSEGDDVFDAPAKHSAENRRRIAYLFDHDLYDLPDSERPDCHRLKSHGYTAVYGRMRWDIVAPTVTGGFGSTGQGRFVHPLLPRTMTPHEAARVQFFPDFFRFRGVRRRSLQSLIGNAVPPKIAYVLALELIK